jgi:hypothetical protein
MDLEVAVDGQDVVYRKIEDPQGGPTQDARCEWASKIESRAREVFGRDPNRIVFRYLNDGIRLSVDSSSKLAIMEAIREQYDRMPVRVQAFNLDILRILETV